jgi:glycosyltransferase involved in cell wall biosynthesis
MKNLFTLYLGIIFCFFSTELSTAASYKAPTILFLHHNTPYLAGMENHVLASLQTFIQNGHQAFALVPPKSKIQALANTLGLPTIECDVLDGPGPALAQKLALVCEKTGANIIFCQRQTHLDAVNILKQHKIKVTSILKLHMHGISKVARFLNEHVRRHLWPDGIVCVNHHQLDAIRELEKKHKTKFRAVVHSPSFFLADRFPDFLPTTVRNDETLAKHFNISTEGRPTFCMIGNMYANTQHKNYPLLLKALTILKTKWHDSYLCLIAGDGPHRPQIEALANKLGLCNDVIFLGYTRKIPELLNSCNFHVLSSSNESFGIAHVEAGLLNKASIGATQTGADDIIIDGVTGLIFKNSNAQDLALKIHTLLSSKDLCKKLGENAKSHIQANLSNQMKYKQHMELFKSLQIC